jgi:hypothetical protein
MSLAMRMRDEGPLAVACPLCGAPAYEFCVRLKGENGLVRLPAGSSHERRTRAAWLEVIHPRLPGLEWHSAELAKERHPRAAATS